MTLKPVMLGIVAVIVVFGVVIGQDYAVIRTAQEDVLLMDTFVRLVAEGREAESVLVQAVAEMSRLESLLSAHIPGSDVWRINESQGEPVVVSPEIIDVLELATLVYDKSDGTFDVTVGAVMRTWGFGTDTLAVPSAEALAEAMRGVGFDSVAIDSDTRTVQLTNPYTRLDLGGIAKGYIVDRALEFIRSQGIKHAIVDAGGDVRVMGGRPGKYLWDKSRPARVGVQDPFSPEGLIAIVEVSEGSVLTSGDYERFFVQDEVRYTHIIDPRTGYPARGITSATIVTEEAALADAIATAVMVLGRDEGMKLINSWAGVEGMLITEDEEILISNGLKNTIQVLR
ncbi:MAG: thiamine biosynthesis lipoprotein [Bacillota bacterium]|nr:MAG: thiamine biosynthesis lipoprotein [Bacillota bacterium]MBS3949110.1 FAD:protein FMN transferase [Peptococcaceae bacterium]